MRALRLLALAAALVVPAAAAHAQVGIYLGAPVRYAAPAYAPGGYYSPIHWDHRIYARPYLDGPWSGVPVYGGFHREWRGYRGWEHDGRYRHGGRW